MLDTHSIILFDGVCLLCNYAVKLVIRHDRHNCFRFATIQSETGRDIQIRYLNANTSDSVILVENEKGYTESEAVLKIARKLSWFWPLYWLFIWCPKFLRDPVYRLIARSRYRWFGKYGQCTMPAEKDKWRFL